MISRYPSTMKLLFKITLIIVATHIACSNAVVAAVPSLTNNSTDSRVGKSAILPAAHELQAAIDRGIEFLLRSQNSNGWWSTSDQPAVTALVITALNLEPSGRYRTNRSSELNRAYDFILTSAKPDGSIQRTGLANYNTSLCLVALATAQDTHFNPVILAARHYLAGTQSAYDAHGTNESAFDGGIGYGSKYQHSDLNNTLAAIEAMRVSQTVIPVESPRSSALEPEIDWRAVAHFVQNCQNLSSHNHANWVSDSPKDRGGFVYYPGLSMAGGVTNAQTGRVALRSYGSMSYGGLLSYIYANVDKKDPRVTAVLDWLRMNYTIEENPGMGQQGYFYYLHLMTKALIAAGVEKLKLSDGQIVDWRAEVSRRLLDLQKPDGSWVNPEKRWWETDPNLVTSYALMTLEILHGNLEK